MNVTGESSQIDANLYKSNANSANINSILKGQVAEIAGAAMSIDT